MPEIVWGDVPTWLTSLGSLGALIFAVMAVLSTRKTFQLESTRDQAIGEAKLEQDAFTRRAQAALVSTWWGQSHEARVSSGNPDSGWGAYLRNASEAPIYKAQMTVTHTNLNHGRAAIRRAVVPPGPSSTFIPIQMPVHVANGSHHDHFADYRVSLRFTDAGGLRWIRDEYGALKQLESALVIWTSPETAEVLAPFTAEFLATYGVSASFDNSLIESRLEARFLKASDDPNGEGCPDILVGTHDWLGNLLKHEAIEPIVLTDGYHAEFPDSKWALDALSLDGKTYGVPSSLDTVALIRNLDLAPDLPDTFEQLLVTGRALRDAGQVQEILSVPVGASGDPFLAWPLISSAGGWLFGQRGDGSWDSSILGVNTPETIAAFEKIRTLGELGILRPEVGGAQAVDDFLTGRSAFLLATSGVVSLATDAGIRFAVSQVPPFENGKVPQSFVAVYAFFVARNGRNRLIASDLAPDYLSRPEVVEQFGKSLHVVPREITPTMDPAIATFHALCCQGVAMPSFAQMRGVWDLLGAAEVKLIHGEESAPVANQLAEDISTLFA
ncbi:MAG: extracellular solute-binding protein [Dermatophilaceae bacterium]